MTRRLLTAILLFASFSGASAAENPAAQLILHFDFNSVQLKREAVIDALEHASAMGYNAVLWEVENKIRWESHPEIVADEAFSKAEFREILARAKELGLRPIPLLQTLGHAEYVLMHGGHADWMEDPAFPACYCVSKPAVRAFLKDMIHEYLELFGPDVTDFHLGCDEAKAFHTCPACTARGSKFAVFHEHFTDVSAELRARGIKPGVWCDFLFESRDLPEVRDLVGKVSVWFWDYKSDGYARMKPQSRWQGQSHLLEQLGFDMVLATSSESYRDSSYLPRYRDHGANLAWGSRFARSRGYRGHCVTSWSAHCSPKRLQYPLWKVAAAVWKDPATDGRKVLDEACLGQFGVPLVTLEDLTDWDWTLADFQGETWGRLLKPSVPAPKDNLRSVAAEMRRKLGEDWRRQLSVVSAWHQRRIGRALKDLEEPKTPDAALLKEGAGLELCYLAALDEVLSGRIPDDVPLARTGAYYSTFQAPASAALSAAIAWSILQGEPLGDLSVK